MDLVHTRPLSLSGNGVDFGDAPNAGVLKVHAENDDVRGPQACHRVCTHAPRQGSGLPPEASGGSLWFLSHRRVCVSPGGHFVRHLNCKGRQGGPGQGLECVTEGAEPPLLPGGAQQAKDHVLNRRRREPYSGVRH